MKQKRYYLALGLLLCFGIAHGQLSQYEYWFDDNFAGRVARSIGGSDAGITELDAAHLPDGLHYWHLRVKNTDGSYSGITSGVFFKSLSGTDAKLEYWYNDDFESRQVIPSPAGNDITVADDLDMLDMPAGLNRLNLRFAGGAVSGSYVMKTEVGATDKLEYWYNDDFESRTPVSPAEVGGAAETGRLDVRAMPFGLNRFHLRFADGAVHTSYVMKSVAGSEKKLEYWFDDDYSGSKTISSDVYADEVSISSSIDAGGLDEGMHRIHFRPVSNVTEYASVSTDFFLKGKRAEEGSYEVTHAKYWVDGNKSQSVSVPVTDLNYSNVFTTFMDADTISFGNHTLGIQIMNSAGMWSAIETAAFKKPLYYKDNIELQVSLTDKYGSLLQWNSMPYIAYYKVFDNGSEKGIYKHESHPVSFEKEISSSKGLHHYQVKAYDASDNIIYTSNKISLTVPSLTKLTGLLTVYVQDGNGALIENADIYNKMITDIFRDDDPKGSLWTTKETNQNATSKTGQYNFQVPYYTKGTVSARKEGYTITPRLNQIYRIDDQNPSVTAYFEALKVGESEDDYSPELEMASEIQGVPKNDDGYVDFSYWSGKMTVTVKNITGQEWKGWVAIKIGINVDELRAYYSSNSLKVYVELPPKSDWLNGNFSGEQTITFSNVPSSMFTANSQNINVALYSMRKMNDVALPPKLIQPTKDYTNPYGISNTDVGALYLAAYPEALEAALKDVASTLKRAGSVHEFLSSAHSELTKINVNSELGNILGSLENYSEGLQMTRGILTNATDYFQKDSEITQFLGDLAKYGKTLETISKFLDGKVIIDAIRIPPSYTELKEFILRKLPGMEDGSFEPEDFFTIIKTVSKDAPAPIKAVFEPLFTVGSAYVDRINEIKKYLFNELDANLIGRNNGHHIQIEVSGKSGQFKGKDIAGAIKSVKFIGNSNSSGTGNQVTREYAFYPNTADGDFAEYRRKGDTFQGLVYCSQIQILWKNGRITWVPVHSDFIGHKHEGDGVINGGQMTDITIIKFKSEVSKAIYMADKLTIQSPDWW
ncbi:MAG: hypothetical protein LBM08_00120 [Dysgonamonadaceae bacterium]|nr:hypothetical protein [Dysgonamonadaceae bacterium]